MLTDDPFAEPLPRRDRYDRPLLVPAGGGEPIPYQRMSTLSGFVCDDFGLTKYNARLLARGMGLREDLCAMAAALPPIHDLYCDAKTLTKEQRLSDSSTKKKLDEYIEAAREAAHGNYKANSGTAIHGFIEGGSAEDAPERMKPDVQACLDLFTEAGVEVLASEVFVVNDELGAAGSFDALVRWPGYGPCIADVKTGKVDGKGLQFAVQLAGYANSLVYDLLEDTRAPLESLSGGERVSRSHGVVLHVPLGGGKAVPYRIDLRLGLRAARLATQVRQARKVDAFMAPITMTQEVAV